MTPLLVALLLSSNASGKTLVRTNPGTTVPIAGFQGPLITDDANTVAHDVWNGAAMIPVVGPTWTMNGTVPQVAKSGKTPAGAGPFSGTTYYSMAPGHPLDFAGDFTMCVVFTRPAPATTSKAKLINSYLTSPLRGYFSDATASTARFCDINSTCAGTANGVIPAVVNVFCAGRSGTTNYAKLNLGATATATSTITDSSNGTARLGEYDGGGTFALDGTIYELWATTSTWNETDAVALLQRVKARAGVTAW